MKLDNSRNGSDCLKVSSHSHNASNGGKICSSGKENVEIAMRNITLLVSGQKKTNTSG